jgi:hypothetical protein
VIWDRARHPGLPEIVLGGYRRGSASNQRTGHRYLESAEDVVRWGLLQGPEYGVILFDEGTRSGSSIAGRKQMPVLLDYLRAGAVQGIVTEDIKRLTGDQTGIDGLEIARVLQERRGILLTRRRRYDLRNGRDFEDFQESVLAAGEERREIRDTFYEGQEDRAKRVLRGLAAPMFRRWPVVGYRWANVFAKSPDVLSADDLQCERAWTLIANGHPMASRGVIQKTYTKCDVCGPWVEAVRRELNAGHMTLSAVAAALNKAGIKSPWKSKGRGGAAAWSGQLLIQMILDPTYYGLWQWVKNPSASVDVWLSIKPTYSKAFPELAYWSDREAQEWKARYVDSRVPMKHRITEHPLVGLVACWECGDPFLAAGSGHHVPSRPSHKPEGGKLRCRNARNGKCAKPVYIDEGRVWTVLDAIFPSFVRRVGNVRERAERHVANQKPDVKLSQLEALDRREAGLIALAGAGQESVTPMMRTELERIKRQRLKLQQKLAAVPSSRTLTEHTAMLSSSRADDPIEIYSAVTYPERAALWRLALMDESGVVRPVRVRRVGSNKFRPTYEAETPDVAGVSETI